MVCKLVIDGFSIKYLENNVEVAHYGDQISAFVMDLNGDYGDCVVILAKFNVGEFIIPKLNKRPHATEKTHPFYAYTNPHLKGVGFFFYALEGFASTEEGLFVTYQSRFDNEVSAFLSGSIPNLTYWDFNTEELVLPSNEEIQKFKSVMNSLRVKWEDEVAISFYLPKIEIPSNFMDNNQRSYNGM
jgi:hypothetical protein